MVNNLQSTKQFNQDLRLKICPDPTGECSLNVRVIQSELLDYPASCPNFTAGENSTKQPYHGKITLTPYLANSFDLKILSTFYFFLKPVFGGSGKVRFKPACSATETS